MEEPQKQILNALEKANNVLVTVSRNPSVDQLSAAIALTLALNKLGKHGIAVFSGEVPSTIEFLQPEKTLEKTTDSLRDFIISLDKAKADKLRYKVEDDMVKIFITPYKTSLSQDDLDFSQGDFNVEVVVALGVHQQPELDQAIISHGRILHDATVVGVNVSGESTLGSINWTDTNASSLSEMIASIVPKLKENILDNQMATALLTGIVAETERFSNDKTSPETMQISSQLMAAGANQQLVATQLEQPTEPQSSVEQPQHEGVPAPQVNREDGALEIDHAASEQEQKPVDSQEKKDEQIHIDEHGELGLHPGDNDPVEQPANEQEPEEVAPVAQEQRNTRRPMALTPPVTGGQLTANTEPEGLSPSTDILGNGVNRSSVDGPNLSRRSTPATTQPSQTLSQLEESVNSPHIQQQTSEAAVAPIGNSPPVEQQAAATLPEAQNVVPEASTTPVAPDVNPLEDARNAVMAAMGNQPADTTVTSPDELQAKAQEIVDAPSPSTPLSPPQEETQISADGTLTVHPAVNPEPFGPPVQPTITDPNAPPEVPPPMMPPSFPPNDNHPQ